MYKQLGKDKVADRFYNYSSISPKNWTNPLNFLLMCLKIAEWVATSVESDQMLHSRLSGLGLHCLLKPVCTNTWELNPLKSGDT